MTLIRCWQDNDKNCVCSFILSLTVCFSLSPSLSYLFLWLRHIECHSMHSLRTHYVHIIQRHNPAHSALDTLANSLLRLSLSFSRAVSCLYLVPAFCALSIHFTLGLFGLMWNWITHFCVAPSRTSSPFPNCFFSISKMITFCSPHCGPWYSEPVTAPPPSPWVAPFLARMRDNLIDEFRFCCCCCCCCHNALVSIAVSLLLRCNFLLYSLISFVSFALLLSGSGSCKILTVNCVFRQGYSGSAWRGGALGEVEVCVCVFVAFAFAFVASFVWHEKLRMPHEMTAVKLPATGTCRLWLQRRKERWWGRERRKRRGEGCVWAKLELDRNFGWPFDTCCCCCCRYYMKCQKFYNLVTLGHAHTHTHIHTGSMTGARAGQVIAAKRRATASRLAICRQATHS